MQREGDALSLIDEVLPLWAELDDFRGLVDGLRRGVPETLVHGLPAPGAALLVAACVARLGRPTAVVTPDWRDAETAEHALGGWLGPQRVRLFPPRDFLPYALVAHSPELAARRLAVLEDLVGPSPAGDAAGPPVLVLPVASLRRLLAPPEVFAAAVVHLRAGQEVDPLAVGRQLQCAGYEREVLVERPGAWSLRGGILDVFPLTSELPLRIEWFGDTIESIRRFAPDSQRSTETVAEVRIPPAREVPAPSGEAAELAIAAARAEAAEQARRLSGSAAERALEVIEGRPGRGSTEAGAAGGGPQGTDVNWEALLPYAYPPAGILDYLELLPGRPLTFVLDAARSADQARQLGREETERFAGFLRDGRQLPRQASAFALPGDLHGDVYVTALPRSVPGTAPQDVLGVACAEITPFRGQMELAAEDLRRWHARNYRILCLASTPERRARMRRELEPAGVPVEVKVGGVPAGCELPGLRLAVLTESDLFGRRPRRHRVRRPSGGLRLQSYEDLQVGDFVVHVQHGIGQYLGAKTLDVQGVRRDYLMVRYEGADRLYVPTDQIELIQKYVGGEGREPRVGRLGSSEWQRTKQRVKESVKEMAEELLQLYASRQALEGHAFPEDTPWQREFEDAFPFEETADQLQAALEIKADMERAAPMDRLLCGDVGFGKTEVAMRAVFKALADGRQVAVLVPTTILAEQHYLTFSERFRGFPVRVAMLSRFRSKKEQEETITGLRKGSVDVVVGTHRLIQGDIDFKDLGLLIVDEEHRFGVAHKERLKQMRRTVDVLTMTATPIPRTLHMALASMRDMSVIETPPEDRYPVETYVLEWSEALVRDAIERELHRRGQVYYVHNRVQGIERVHERLRKLAPGADIVVAHGQMPEDELERVMVEFWHGEHDILLCTTIIESGLDIPNANTLVVEDADRMGLAQLYQIRGRVGRSSRLAYAYFTYRRDKILTEVAEKRLEAIKEFTELGSGFKIALRDLELRGAGNLLGPEQHGFVAAVGFDLYAQLLEEAVRELRGERAVPQTRATVELRVDAFIPDGYIRDARVKLDFYKKIHAAGSAGDVAAVREELADRFGPPPPAVDHLLQLAGVRLRAQELGLLAVTHDGPRVTFSFPGYLAEMVGQIERNPPRLGRRLRVQRRPKPALTLLLDGSPDDETVIADVDAVLDLIAQHPAVKRWQEALQV